MHSSLSSYNNTHSTLIVGLIRLLRRAFKGGYDVVPYLGMDYCVTRARRTCKGAVGADIYRDGSGFEVAFLGRVFILGLEAKTHSPALQ